MSLSPHRAGTIKLGVVGAGTMGMRHARTIAAHPSATLVAVVDHSLTRAQQAAAFAPGASAAVGADILDRCDAVIVATSTSQHREVALSLLSRGIPVLVEKPLALTSEECRAIIDCSGATGVPLMCGFVERFNPAWLGAVQRLDNEPRCFDAVRESPPVTRAGSGVVTDLMIHDLDLAWSVFGGRRRAPTAAVRCDRAGTESLRAAIEWDGARVTLSANREASVRRRVVRMRWDFGCVEADLLAHTLTIRSRLTARQQVVDCRSAETPMTRQLSHFVALVAGEVDCEAERTSTLRPHELAFEIERSVLDPRTRATAPNP